MRLKKWPNVAFFGNQHVQNSQTSKFVCQRERENQWFNQIHPKKMKPIAFAWRGKEEGEFPASLTVEDLLHL